MVKILLMIASLASPLGAQEILISANPDLLYSTANDYGPWGSPEFLNSPNNDYGPIGSPDFLGSVSNDYGVGLKASTLLLLTPSLITPIEFTAPFDVTPVIEP
jgi:hypothetical protein